MAPPEPDGRLARTGAVVVFALVSAAGAAGLVLIILARLPLWPDFLVNILFYAFPVVGLLVALRRPSNRIAWLCLGIGAVWVAEGLVLAVIAYEAARPGLVPRPDLVLAVGLPLWVPGILLMGTFLLLLFPDGRLPSVRWRPIAWLSASTIVVLYLVFLVEPRTYADYGFPHLENPLAMEGLHASAVVGALVALLPACILAAAVALLRRFRRARGIERLQLKWLVAAGGLVAGLYMVVIVVDIVVRIVGGASWIGQIGTPVVMLFTLIPVAIGVAVLRYRLYEIDRLLSRTVSYALVVAVLVVVYAGGVLLVRGLFPLQSELAVAASTLAVAALFNPLRRRVQRRVDRRFNRSRYDAEREVERFVHRLRGELDLDTLGAELMQIAGRTMAPAGVSLWLRQATTSPTAGQPDGLY